MCDVYDVSHVYDMYDEYDEYHVYVHVYVYMCACARVFVCMYISIPIFQMFREAGRRMEAEKRAKIEIGRK